MIRIVHDVVCAVTVRIYSKSVQKLQFGSHMTPLLGP